jgi:two-component system sensor kinase FixL
LESCPDNAVLLERIADAVVVCNRDLTLSHYSNAGGVLLGLAHDAIGTRLDMCECAPVQQLAAGIAICLRNGSAAEREIAVGQRTYLVRLVPEPSLDAGRGGVVAAFFDQTDRIRIARESRRMAKLLDQSDDAITMHDFAGRILAWNKGAERMYGYDEAEALTMNVAALLPADRGEDYRSVIEQLVGQEAGDEMNQCYETVRLHKNGRLIDVWVTASALRDEHGVAYAVAATERDLTLRNEIEAKRLRAELAHLERVGIMGEMAASLAHEVNQPLVAIANFCDAALTRAKNAPKPDMRLVGLLDQACEQVQRAGDIVRHLRDFVLKQHRQTLRVDLNELVVDTLRFGNNMRRERGVAMQLDLAKDLPTVMIDKVQVQLVLLNLERNGIEAMQHSPSQQRRLTLSTARSPHGVRLTIQDSGPGLDVDQIERMFDPFETSKPAGMGMGLWISRAIIQAHGGRLWCEPVQHGARFSFTLPAADEDA